MGVNLVLLALAIGVTVVLLGIEAYTVMNGKPTISARIQALGRSAPLVIILCSFFAGLFLQHFFG